MDSEISDKNDASDPLFPLALTAGSGHGISTRIQEQMQSEALIPSVHCVYCKDIMQYTLGADASS